MKEYVDQKYLALLELYHLHTFEALWSLELDSVDNPNRDRGGWSSVCRLTLTDKNGVDEAFFIKRQCNHLSRTWRHPWGEPTFAREFQNIEIYWRLGLPTLDVVYFAWRRTREGPTAILVTRALNEYQPLSELCNFWENLTEEDRRFILTNVGSLIGKLHQQRLTHHCLYPNHIFVGLARQIPIRFIDLEKTRFQWLRKREAISDMESFLRRIRTWSLEEKYLMMQYYLLANPIFSSPEEFSNLLELRRLDKAAR